MLTSGTLLIVLFFIFSIWYFVFHVRRRRLYKLAAQYDGPPSLPIIGNILQTLVPLTDITDQVLEGCQYYKSPSRLWIGHYLSVYIWDPENAKIVLNSPHALAKEPYLYKLIENISGQGLVTLPVDKWRRHRKLISPVFNQKFLEDFFDVFVHHSKKFVQNIHNTVDTGIFDVHDHLTTYAMDTIMDTILDFPEESRDSSSTLDFVAWFENILVTYTTRMTNVWYFSDFIFNRSSAGKKFHEDKLNLYRHIATLFQRWEENSIRKRAASKGQTNQTDSYKPAKLIDHLMSISDGSGKFTSEELNGEIHTLISAGYETVSSTLGFLLILLGMHPEIQDKAFKEIKNVLAFKEKLDYMDLRNLEYLERVIKEALRLFPGAPALGRYTEQEIQLADHVIPANTSVLVVVLALHRDPNIWPNPSIFDPDRFLPEAESNRHPFSWLPFSTGPRNCIGIRFAYISLKTILSIFLINYKVTTDYKTVDDIKLTAVGVLKPTNGYKIGITRRHY